MAAFRHELYVTGLQSGELGVSLDFSRSSPNSAASGGGARGGGGAPGVGDGAGGGLGEPSPHVESMSLRIMGSELSGHSSNRNFPQLAFAQLESRQLS
jgi:hypothetical protein